MSPSVSSTEVETSGLGHGSVVSVVAADDQDDEPVDLARWEALAGSALLAEGATGPAELSLTFVAAAAMADLNGRFMDGDGPTDVLAFPLDGADLVVGGNVPRLLGDVVICPAVAARNAPDHAGTYEDELALLVVHGVLAVLGHDHATAAETEAMQAREHDLLDRFHRRPR